MSKHSPVLLLSLFGLATLAGCFNGSQLQGERCESDDDCGPDQFCQSQAGNTAICEAKSESDTVMGDGDGDVEVPQEILDLALAYCTLAAECGCGFPNSEECVEGAIHGDADLFGSFPGFAAEASLADQMGAEVNQSCITARTEWLEQIDCKNINQVPAAETITECLGTSCSIYSGDDDTDCGMGNTVTSTCKAPLLCKASDCVDECGSYPDVPGPGANCFDNFNCLPMERCVDGTICVPSIGMPCMAPDDCGRDQFCSGMGTCVKRKQHGESCNGDECNGVCEANECFTDPLICETVFPSMVF